MVADIKLQTQDQSQGRGQETENFSYDPLILQAAQQIIKRYKETRQQIKLESFDVPHKALLSMSHQLEELGIHHNISEVFVAALKDYVMARGGSFIRTANATPIYISVQVADRRPDFRFEDGLTEMAALDEFEGQMQGASTVQMQTTISGTKTTSNQVNVDNMFLYTKGLKLWIQFEAPTKSELDGMLSEQQADLSATAEAMGGAATAEQLEELLAQLEKEGQLTPEISELIQDMLELRALVEAGITPESEGQIKELSDKIITQLEDGLANGTLPPLLVQMAAQTLAATAKSFNITNLIDLSRIEPVSIKAIAAVASMAGASEGPLADLASQLAAEIMGINPSLNLAQITQILADSAQIAIIVETDPQFLQILEEAGMSAAEIKSIMEGLKNPSGAESALAQMKLAEGAPKIAGLLKSYGINFASPGAMHIAMATGTTPAQAKVSLSSTEGRASLRQILETISTTPDSKANISPTERASIAETVTRAIESQTVKGVEQARLQSIADKIAKGGSLSQQDVAVIQTIAQAKAAPTTATPKAAQPTQVQPANNVIHAAAVFAMVSETGTVTPTTPQANANATPEATASAKVTDISSYKTPAAGDAPVAATPETIATDAPKAAANENTSAGDLPISPEAAMAEVPPKADAPKTSESQTGDKTSAKMDYEGTQSDDPNAKQSPENQIADKPQGCGGCGICATCRGADVDKTAKVANDANDFMADLDTGEDPKADTTANAAKTNPKADATAPKMDYDTTKPEDASAPQAPETQVADKPQGCGGCGICATCRGADVDKTAKVANDANDFMADLDSGEPEKPKEKASAAPTPRPQ